MRIGYNGEITMSKKLRELYEKETGYPAFSNGFKSILFNNKYVEWLEQRQENCESIVIGEIESHIKSMMIEADEHAKMGNYAKALSLKEQTTGFKRGIDVIRKHRTK